MRKLTAADKRWMQRVADAGCLICGSPCQVHHLQLFTPRNNCGVIGLCPEHHTGEFSIHSSKEQFLNVYGSEPKLLADQIRRLA